MTVDMLAATFFWPEGTLLGAQALPPDADPEAPRGEDAPEETDGAPEDGFWATVARNLWRSGAPSSTTTAS